MGKPSRKTPPPPPAAPPEKSRGKAPLVVGAIVLFGLAAAAFVVTQNNSAAPGTPSAPPGVAPTTPAPADQAAAKTAAAPPVQGTARPAGEPLKPHTQKTYPALTLPEYPLGRPPDVIRAAYQFAAEHPEILSYVPCFCGCERSGHQGNEDCFVKARAANGDVTQWEPHGMECNVCLDVATQAMQMHASGASVRDIRAAVEQKWAAQAAQSHTHTPTPDPPKN